MSMRTYLQNFEISNELNMKRIAAQLHWTASLDLNTRNNITFQRWMKTVRENKSSTINYHLHEMNEKSAMIRHLKVHNVKKIRINMKTLKLERDRRKFIRQWRKSEFSKKNEKSCCAHLTSLTAHETLDKRMSSNAIQRKLQYALNAGLKWRFRSQMMTHVVLSKSATSDITKDHKNRHGRLWQDMCIS